MTAVSMPVRTGHAILHTIQHLLPATIYFFIAFNLIVFTTNLLVHDYWFQLAGFLLASTSALVVGKAVLLADKLRLIDRFRGAPLIQPIIYRTVFYAVVVLFVRLLERLIHLVFDERGFVAATRATLDDFTWEHFAAVQIWIFTTFLIYVTAREVSYLMGEGQMFRLFFRHRSNEHRLTRRQHVRALMEISRLAENTPRDQLLNPDTPQGERLLTIIDALRKPATSSHGIS